MHGSHLVWDGRGPQQWGTDSASHWPSLQLRLHILPPRKVILAIQFGESSECISGTGCIRKGAQGGSGGGLSDWLSSIR